MEELLEQLNIDEINTIGSERFVQLSHAEHLNRKDCLRFDEDKPTRD